METMDILGCHPLFDHNNSFDIDFMQNMDAPYQFCGMTIKQEAPLSRVHGSALLGERYFKAYRRVPAGN